METRCNCPVPGWNRTRNRTGNLDPLLTLASAHASRGNDRYIPNVEHLYLTIPSQALTLSQLRSYQMFEVFLIVSINNSVGVWAILNFPLLGDVFLYRLARRIPLKEEVP